MGKKIRYHSFDFDGSLSNEAYCDELDRTVHDQSKGQKWTDQATAEQADQAILKANKDFLDGIILTRGDSEDYVIVGSNRQDIIMDFGNGSAGVTPPGSAFPRLQALATRLNAKFDKFLLADLESGNKFGTEFDTILDSGILESNGSYKSDTKWSKLDADDRFAKLVDDSSKVSLLFAQMQKASMEHPHDEIEFNFHDDRKDIVEELQSFFEKNPNLIPKNVVLNLRGYSGPQPEGVHKTQRRDDVYPYGKVQDIAKIQGKGTIPKATEEWADFYKHMRAAIISEANDPDLSHINVARQFNPGKLLAHYTNEAITINEIPKLAQEQIATHLRKVSFTDRQAFTEGGLEQQLLAKAVGHEKSTGRAHRYSVSAETMKTIKQEFQQLKGDHLKREILLDFKSQIENISTIEELQKFETENIKNKSESYKILATSQDLTTRILHLETDSVKALKHMINEKRVVLNTDLESSKKSSLS
ncbi:hypothetical protein [Legionella shakespearei]|uniref:Dot/Icm T4SS effector n=1 Tax=Legionella shakespearei DSM 23087 TaxID=1122169 RepID=A0A0W0YVQ3_9GAMM|nr:hypothetical protein [Legionella shakespearei]KTD60930.1 Dot/Icm T4SS effector [Legionella shakespearei DSM 23087]